MSDRNPPRGQLSVDESAIAKNEDLARKAFAEHECTMRLDQGMFRSWRCMKPKSWAYGFDVHTTPGHLIVTGDIGDLIVSRCEDMIDWSRGAVKDPHYFAEKVPHSIKTREWSYARSMEWIDQEIHDAKDCYGDEEGDKRIKRLVAFRKKAANDGINGEMDEHEFCTALYESELALGCDWPDLEVFNGNFLWCRQAVIWLLRSIARDE